MEVGGHVSDERSTGVPPSGWAIILSDWKKARAEVTVTLRNGATFTGVVSRLNSGIHDEVQLQSHVDRRHEGSFGGGLTRRHQVLHDIDLTEVVAVTAVAP